MNSRRLPPPVSRRAGSGTNTLRLASTVSIVVALACLALGSARAVTIDMVTVGDAGNESAPWVEGYDIGFRLAAPVAVPEPSAYAMALAGLVCGGYLERRRRRHGRKNLVRLTGLLFVACGLLPTPATAAVVSPSGLSAGSQYQIAFVTSLVTTSTNKDISFYNSFVTNLASQSASLPSGITWTAMVGTPSRTTITILYDSNGNQVGSQMTTVPGVTPQQNCPTYADIPIYNTLGERIVSSGTSIWNASSWSSSTWWENAIHGNESGVHVPTVSNMSNVLHGIVGAWVQQGQYYMLNDAYLGMTTALYWGNDQILTQSPPASELYRIFALSSPITVAGVPEPATHAMALAGLACSGFSMWRRRKTAARALQAVAAILSLLGHAMLSSLSEAGIVITSGATTASVSAHAYSGTAVASVTANLGEQNNVSQSKSRNEDGTTTFNVSDNQLTSTDTASVSVGVTSYSYYGSTGVVHYPEIADDYSHAERSVQAQLFARDGSENFPFGPFQYNANENDIRYSLGEFSYTTQGVATGYGTTSADISFTLTFETTFSGGEVGLRRYDDNGVDMPLFQSVSPGTPYTVSWSRSSLSINEWGAFGIYMRSLEGGGLLAPGDVDPFRRMLIVTGGTQTQTQAGYATLSGATPIDKIGIGTAVLDKANTLTGPTTVSQGTLQLGNANALSTSAVTVAAGGKLSVGPQVQATVSSLVNNGLVDVGLGGLTVTSGQTEEGIMAAIVAGRADGTWSGTAGITSSAVAGMTDRAVGWIDNGGGSFRFGFAAAGDLDMNGLVDLDDVITFVSSGLYDTGLPAVWGQGDYDYNGLVDLDDLIAFVSGGLYDVGPYNAAPVGPAPTGLGSLAPVPEPSTNAMALAGLACGGCSMWRRLKRHPVAA